MRGHRIAATAMALGTIMVLAAGCGSSSSGKGSSSATTAAAAPTTTAAGSTATTSGASGTAMLVAHNITFNTNKLTFKTGQKVNVTTQNQDSIEHNFTFAGANVSTDVDAGETKVSSFTAPAPGTYNFHCKYHPTRMFGTVTVTG
jgi:plastocyanin